MSRVEDTYRRQDPKEARDSYNPGEEIMAAGTMGMGPLRAAWGGGV